ncbi:MAG: hypothetical protein K6E50_01235 [Lachnospiraceae bacterium]|nr:hypothetical protein [Lachnospiraceae bacterium]
MDGKWTEALAKMKEMSGSQSGDGSIYISSINDAIFLLQRNMRPDGARERRAIVDYITNPENRVLGECDIIHNLIMDLFRVGDYDIALKVCDYALKTAPFNCDILGDAIKACGDSNQFDLGEEYLKKAEQLPKECWSFRLFLYAVDFLKTKAKADLLDEETYKRAIDLADEYIRILPYDEHGYNQKAELLILHNRREEAIGTLKKFIFEVHPDEKDSASGLICAQCCVTLLNILDDSNDYDFIIRICDKGLCNTTQEQPSASIGFFVYRKALALDAKAHIQNFAQPDTISAALKFYQAAYDLNQDRQYAKTIEQRYAVLRPFAQEFKPLVKRDLYVSERPDLS